MGREEVFALILLAGGLLQSGATAAEAPDLRSRAHTVAVVSSMGDRIYYQPENVSLFYADGVSSRVLNGSDLDGAVINTATETLRADVPDIKLVTADIPRDQLLSAANEVYRTDKGAVEAMMAAIKAWREANTVDLIIVFLPIESSLNNRPNTRMFFGMGVTWNEGAVLMQAVVLDGRTGEVLGEAKAQALDPLDAHMTRAAFLDTSPESTKGLADYMRAMLASTVPGLLHNTGL